MSSPRSSAISDAHACTHRPRRPHPSVRGRGRIRTGRVQPGTQRRDQHRRSPWSTWSTSRTPFDSPEREGRQGGGTRSGTCAAIRGRVPNLEGARPDLAGVQRDPATGRVVLEEPAQCATYPCGGDATGSNMLVNLGELAGRHAVEELGGCPEAMETNGSSTIMFLDPEVAGVGVNEQQCRQRNIPTALPASTMPVWRGPSPCAERRGSSNRS